MDFYSDIPLCLCANINIYQIDHMGFFFINGQV